MNKVSWIVFSVIVVLLFGGLIAWTRIANPPIDVTNVNATQIIGANESNGQIGDHVEGNRDAKVLLIEYGDFQCPSCAAVHPNVKVLLEDYGDDIAFVFRHFPLTNIHPNAKAASGAAEAAGLQGKFWEMYDKIFDNQSAWSNADSTRRTDVFTQYARELDLDIEQFTADLTSNNVSRKISFDIALAKRENVSATPSFFLNGEKLEEATASSFTQGDNTALKARIDELLKK